MSGVTTKMPCRHGCDGNEASRYPRICLVAVGCRKGQHQPLELIMPVPVCRECQKKTSVQDFLLPEGRERIRGAMRALGKADPDFDNAWLEWGRIGDERWVEAHQALVSRETRQ